jgi:hypothetical protein
VELLHALFHGIFGQSFLLVVVISLSRHPFKLYSCLDDSCTSASIHVARTVGSSDSHELFLHRHPVLATRLGGVNRIPDGGMFTFRRGYPALRFSYL